MNKTVSIIGIPDVYDGLFFTIVNHPQKVSTLTWRGTKQMHANSLAWITLTGLRYRYPDYSVVINGQSLGGVKAMLTAAYLAKLHLEEMLYTHLCWERNVSAFH